MERRILHVDLDAFFAAVEELDNPKLKGTPVIIGGTSERGVVSTANYEARKYGIHSAMPSYLAKQKCPHGNFVRGNHERYKEVSKQVFRILYSITEKVQPISIDEAYLDVTDEEMDPIEIASLIKKRVKEEVGITISVGVSYNKFLAKLGSDWNKPNGIFVINKEDVSRLLEPLNVSKVHGLGKKSVEKLNRIGIFKIRDLLKYSKEYLDEYLGSFGGEIYYLIRGMDNREVKSDRTIKSIGKETTLKKDIINKEEMKESIKPFCYKISQNLYKRDFRAKTITFKYKTSTFKTHTRSKTLLHTVREGEEIYKIGTEMIDEIKFEEEIRLIGITASNFIDGDIEQMTIFG